MIIDKDTGNPVNPEMLEAVDKLKNQLLIVIVKRILRGNETLRIPVEEVDATGQDILNMEVEGNDFLFTLSKKS